MLFRRQTGLIGSLLISIVLLFSCQLAVSQAARGNISGEIFDASGALLPGAQIKIIAIQTNQEHATKADESGFYTVQNLMPGSYSVIVEATGFKQHVQQGIQLATGEKLLVNATLQVGSPSEVITVTLDAPLLRSETGSLGQVIDNSKILDLPLNGRNFISLVTLSSGITLAKNDPNAGFPRINGGRPRTNEYLYDGISVLQPEPGAVAYTPVIDSIQEFKIETNSPPAEFGRFNGGVVNLTTKSGTNALHGSVFEFFRNEALNARNRFASSTANKPVFRRNQFGATMSGPIQKDKTFFFADYQGTRQLIGRVRTSTVPTELQRAGNFTELINGKLVPIYDPATTVKSGSTYTRQQFSYNGVLNSIDPTRFDKVAALLLARYPHPTSSGTANNYTRVGNESDIQDQFDIRVDRHITNHDQVFGRYSYFRDDTTPVTPLPDGSGSITTGTSAPTITGGQSVVASYIHEFGSKAANEFRFGYTRRTINRNALMLNGTPSNDLQLPGIPTNGAFSNTLPTFSISGYQQLGSSSNANSNFRTDVTEVVDQLYRQYGRHAIKAGLDFRWERMDIMQPASPTGLFSFSSLFTDNNSSGGSALASFLLGQVQTFTIDLQQKKIRPRAHIQEYFIQDDWKATSRFTVNAGVRWTLNFPSTEVDNQGAIFNLETQKLDYLGKNGFSRSGRQLHWHDFGPRLGLAYRLGEKTVIRAGYALIWIEQAGITTPFTNPQFPFIQTVSQKTSNSIDPAFTLASGPTVNRIAATPDAGLGQGVFAVNRPQGSGYAQQWNLFIQREITPNMSLSVGYTGSKITHVGIPDANINQLTVAQLALGNALTASTTIPLSNTLCGGKKVSVAQSLMPYPCFSSVSYFRNNVGNTNYHALQARLERRFAKNLSFLASYTFSKLIDEASSVFDSSLYTGPATNTPAADSFNRKLERDVSTGDIPHNFILSTSYELPFGNGRLFNPQGVIGKFTNGWKFSGLLSFQSGIPLAVTQATNFNSFAGFTIQRPNRVSDPNDGAPQTTAQWFNTAAFQVASKYTIGTSSRNPVRGPGFKNLDLALSKHIPIRESVNMEFRAEAFNASNTPPLGAPNVVLGSAGFGSITSAGDPRVIQFALKLMF
jgi:hypothetical protein